MDLTLPSQLGKVELVMATYALERRRPTCPKSESTCERRRGPSEVTTITILSDRWSRSPKVMAASGASGSDLSRDDGTTRAASICPADAKDVYSRLAFSNPSIPFSCDSLSILSKAGDLYRVDSGIVGCELLCTTIRTEQLSGVRERKTHMITTTLELTEIGSCNVSSCAFNANNGCQAKAVTIGETSSAACGTFYVGTASVAASGSTGVATCKAVSCKHNRNLTCGAEAIVVANAATGPVCQTFA